VLRATLPNRRCAEPLFLAGNEETMLEASFKNEFDALVAEALADDESVRIVTVPRTRNGKRSATDGPFAETKEHPGGSS
jgi:hypothetical protein